jgi:hypothetical protein
LFQFIAIPANVLTAIGFFSLGVFVTLFVLTVLLYVALRRMVSASPIAVLLLLLGLSLAMVLHDPAARDRMLDQLNETPTP